MSLARDRCLDAEQMEDLVRQTRKRYNADPYTVAIIWPSSLDTEGEKRLVRRFYSEIGRWLDHHPLGSGMVDILHHHLRNEVEQQISESAGEAPKAHVPQLVEDASVQLASA